MDSATGVQTTHHERFADHFNLLRALAQIHPFFQWALLYFSTIASVRREAQDPIASTARMTYQCSRRAGISDSRKTRRHFRGTMIRTRLLSPLGDTGRSPRLV